MKISGRRVCILLLHTCQCLKSMTNTVMLLENKYLNLFVTKLYEIVTTVLIENGIQLTHSHCCSLEMMYSLHFIWTWTVGESNTIHSTQKPTVAGRGQVQTSF